MRRASLGAIFLTVVIDLLGFGLVLPFLAEEARAAFGARPFVATLLGAVYSLMQFVCAPIWGRLSDRVGRRPVLLWSIAATCVSNAGLGAALAWGDGIGWLFLARIGAGMATANLSVASAYIADVTPREERSKGMGLIGMAFGIGFVLGPVVGGVLAGISVGGRHGPLACFAAAALSLVNVIWVFFGVGESLPRGGAVVSRGLDRSAALRALADPMLFRVVLVNFLVIVSFSNLEQTFRFYNADEFGMTVVESGMLLAFIGVTGAGVQGVLVRPLAKIVDESALVRAGAFTQAVAFVLVASAAGVGRWLLYLGGALLAVGNGLSQPGISAYVSLRAKLQEQGSALGVSQSAASLGRVFGPGLGGLLYGALGPRSPFLAAAFGMTLATLLALALAPARAQSTSTQTS